MFSSLLSHEHLYTDPRIFELSLRLCLFLSVAVMVLFLWMLLFHLFDTFRFMKMDRLKKTITNVAEKAVDDPSMSVSDALPPINTLFGFANIGVLTKLLVTLPEKPRDALKTLLMQLDCTQFISRKLKKANNDEYIIELIRIIGGLNLDTLAQEIPNIIKSNQKYPNVVFESFLALAQMNNHEYFIKVCKEEGFAQTVSFRSLQEIILTYSGDKEILFSDLLSAPDNYIVRISIKRIGAEGLTALAPKVMDFLDNSNENLVIDALRAIGALKYRPAAKKIIKLFKHKCWEVRNAVVQVLTLIDADSYNDLLIEALQDREWFVRFNAGRALINSSADIKHIHKKLAATNDKFAMEMLEYMTQMKKMGVAR